MSRKKKPENETPEAAEERRVLEFVSNVASRSEKTSWNRKMDNMVTLLTNLEPIEQKILKIIAKEKQPLLDEISSLRTSMVQECIHPYEQLVLYSDHVLCKFCNRKISSPQ